MFSQTNKNIIVGAVVLMALAAGVIWYMQRGEKVSEPPVTTTKKEGLGAQIFEKAQNPLKERLPDVNPFSVDTNPFDAKTNPFRSEYKNPFE